jgi:alkylhydroperoxidase family enzyme
MDAHTQALQKHNVTKEAIQHCIRIASVINAFAQVLTIETK